MNALFCDHMVLQQGKPVPIRGTAEPGGRIVLRFREQMHVATAGPDSLWRIMLDPLKPGGPDSLMVAGNKTHVIRDVMTGEVWIASGQSNMEWPLNQTEYVPQVLDSMHFPDIRMAVLPRHPACTPARGPAIQWRVCTPKNAGEFPAVAAFFARRLHARLQVPVGIVHAAVGGAPAETWTSPDALSELPDFRQAVAEMRARAAVWTDPAQMQVTRDAWRREIQQQDRGMRSNPPWHEPSLNDTAWSRMLLPQLWEQAGHPGYDGIMWFRKTVTLSEKWANAEATLSLGPVDDIDSTWVNGRLAGSLSVWNAPRTYTLSPGFLRGGRNQISIKVTDYQGGGGLYGQPEDLALLRADSARVALSGLWKYRMGVPDSLIGRQPEPFHRMPGMLYHGMIHPLIPMAMRGVIWYQGESNVERAQQYRHLFPVLIRDWRTRWKEDFPFYFVQLPRYRPRLVRPAESAWAEMRAAQAEALRLKSTGMAVTIDLGETDNIHPGGKRKVAERLARLALSRTYDQDIADAGPFFDYAEQRESTFVIHFRHADGLTTADGRLLAGFTMAGPDSVFYRADAVIRGQTVIVSHPEIRRPLAVRYGWADFPECNLMNASGLPAAPFRTDTWPGITR